MSYSTAKLNRIDPIALASNPRATEGCWQRYKPVVDVARARFPQPYLYRPTSHAPSTVVIGLRDAIRAAIAFGFVGSEEEVQSLSDWFGSVVVKQLDEHVFIGRRGDIPGAAATTAQGYSADIQTIAQLTFEELCAFTLLISNGHLRGPVKVLQPPDLSLAPERTNCEIVRAADGSVTLL